MEIVNVDPKLHINQVTPELIDYVVHKIITGFAPHKIILFGSHARGESTLESDLDLFIIQSSTKSNRQVRREIGGALAGRRFGIDLIVRKPVEVELNLQDNNPFYTKHIFKEGKVLYQMDNIRTYEVWLQYAKGDLKVAEREMSEDVPVCHTICFLCQGSAEKFLKGYLVSQGWNLVKTHDISQLLSYCSDYEPSFNSLMPLGELLNEYIIAGRYPGDIAFEMIGTMEAQEALQATQAICDIVLAHIVPITEDKGSNLQHHLITT